MKKYFLLFVAILLSQLSYNASAQKLTPSPDSLFLAPDTVCINQPVTLLPDSLAYRASSYYWGFCSGFLVNAPTGVNLGDNFGFHIPAGIDIVYDSGSYYGFVVNAETTEFLRLNFGKSLTNIPTVTNFGNIQGGLPVNPTSLFILKDTGSQNWFIFVTGGFTNATSTIGRIDFGRHLNNPRPNVVNFENYLGVLDYPKGIFVAQESDDLWFGYVVNHNTNELIRLDFSYNVSNTPKTYDYGNVAGDLQSPTDLAAVYDRGTWHLFVTNEGVSSYVTRFDLGATLQPDPTVLTANTTKIQSSDPSDPDPLTFNFRILQPSSISINRDCGNLYAYITDSTTSQLIGIQMASVTGPYSAVDYNNKGGMNFPSSISSILRSGDYLYGFITNPGDSTLTRLDFDQCHNSSIPSFTEVRPPSYTYDTPGLYNIYLVINQGQPNMQVDCKPIRVISYPNLFINHDTTICEGDTIALYAVSTLADSVRWMSGYNIDTSYLYRDSAKVFPDYSTTYPVNLYYPFGCIVDTAIHVNIRKVRADAGPDRWIRDGAQTTLGGPYTTLGGNYTYHWTPFQFLSDSTVPNPYAFPQYDYTYYLTVTDSNGCTAKDTVVVHVDCSGGLNLPNAFAPNSTSSAVSRFGVLNQEIVQLNYLRIFDRWGVLVFETTDAAQGWDGTYQGKPEPEGVYVYIADGFCPNGTRITKKGNVTLLR